MLMKDLQVNAGRKTRQANMKIPMAIHGQKCLRGQYFSLDAIVAVLIFILALSMLANYWFTAKATMQEGESQLFSEALSISNSLLTPGEDGWVGKLGTLEDRLTIKQVGFAPGYRTNEIDSQKARAFRDLVPYEDGKRLLSTSRNYRIEIAWEGSSIIAGMQPPENAGQVGVATRGIVLYGNGGELLAGTLKVMVWE